VCAPSPGYPWGVRGWVSILLVVVAGGSLKGCGVGDDRAAARQTTERFYAAIRSGDGQAACDQLGESTVTALESQSGQACAEAVTGLSFDPGDVERVQVFATNARVELSTGESAFLSPEQGRWTLSAIGCKPEAGKPQDRPFECEAEA
jgi:hypothetical protein